MSSRGGRQDTAREAHVEDVARVFSSAYAGKNTVGFCTFDRDANAFSLAQAIVRDDDEDVLKLFFRTSGADVVYCSSEFKAAIEKMSDARRDDDCGNATKGVWKLNRRHGKATRRCEV